MPSLSPHFRLEELACRCGCGGEAQPEILANLTRVVLMLERVRLAIGHKPIRITSGYRCAKHNKAVGGRPQSLHLTGRAADIQVDDLLPSQLQAIVIKSVPEAHGIGRHARFTHLDVRGFRLIFDYS
ncbi:DUF882 domain-containing protein [bacterium]|nr:DUF882 domain-containing protein [bacterium]